MLWLWVVCVFLFCFFGRKYYLRLSDEKKLRENLKFARSLDPRPRKVFFVINPIGGGKNAVATFENYIKPVLEAAHFDYQIMITQAHGHAKSIAASVDISSCVNGLVCMGGDGFLHEVVNGIDSRKDADQFFATVPLLVMPTGTGNGLATSCGHLDVHGAMRVLLTQPPTKPLDLLRILPCQPSDEESKRGVVSSLSLTWGAIADHDAYSERTLRGLPTAARLAIAPFLVISRNHPYHGRVRMLACREGPLGKPLTDQELKWITMEDRFWLFVLVNSPCIASDVRVAPRASLDDGFMYLVMARTVTRWQGFQMFLALSPNPTYDHHMVERYKVKELILEPLCNTGNIVIDGELHKYEPVRVTVEPHRARVFTQDT